MFYRYSFTSSLSGIHFHTSMITCLGFVFISWESSFCILSREGGDMSGILIGEGNLESTKGPDLMPRWDFGG